MMLSLSLLALLHASSIPLSHDACERASMPCLPPELQQPPANRDAWVAEDKLRHFFASFAATGVSYGAVRAAGLDRDSALPVAAVAAAALGVWKELRDRKLGKGFSARDLVWDTAGIVLGIVILQQTR
jgi:uncharacterized protein YfiM (DUF2279 family)